MGKSGATPFWKIDGLNPSVHEALRLRSRDRVTLSQRLRNMLEKIGINEDEPLLGELLEPGMLRVRPWELAPSAILKEQKEGDWDHYEGLYRQEFFIRLKIDSTDGRLKMPDEILAHLEINPDLDLWVFAYVFPEYLEIWSQRYRRENRQRLYIE